jgi:SpoVK/Ycf46/Vps4 family AAA+-type ATPase
MGASQIVENVRRLIASHTLRDESNFQKAAETIIQELGVQNRPGEARCLREALNVGDSYMPSQRVVPSNLVVLSKQSQGLISFQRDPRAAKLFFRPETQHALDSILIEYRAAAQLAQHGLLHKARFLFWGPPGCGKTAAAAWLATNLSLPLGIVRLGALITSFVGETGSNLQKALTTANETPMVLLIDEADAIAKARDDANDVGELRRVVNALLQGLDYFAPKRSLIILASNHSHLFDPAVWRRFDDVIAFPLPSASERLAQLRHLTSGLKIVGSLASVARQTSGVSFGEIERAVNEIAKAKVLSGAKTVSSADIISEAKRWRAKMQAALGVRKRRR